MSAPPGLRIVVADDHYVVRLGVVALVDTEPGMRVVGEAADGAQAIELFASLRPDLVLMDLHMPVKSGHEATVEICGRFPGARVLVLTAFDGDVEIQRVLDAGARGCVHKSSTGKKLIPAIHAVAEGQRWIPDEIAARLASHTSFESLSPRELEVLQQLARGLANKEIADVLRISQHTTKDHIKNILGKLRVADRTEAVMAGLQRGILQL